MARSFVLLVGLLFVLSSCKGTDERLSDLSGSLDAEYRLNASVYDAGQLVHEAFVGLIDADTLSYGEMGRGMWYAAQVVERTEVALLRADALSFIAHVTLRFPIPPVSESLVGGRAQIRAAEDSVNQLLLASEKLSIGRRLIPQLETSDPTLVDEALATLRKVSGEDLGTNGQAWRNWWTENEARINSEVASEVKTPLEYLGSLRYGHLGEARAVLGLLANTVELYDLEELRPIIQKSFQSVARQTAEYAILRGLKDSSSDVRVAAARAAREIGAVPFGEAVAAALLRESDAAAKVALMKTGQVYPSKNMARALILALADEEVTVSHHARVTLAALFDGEEMPRTREAWMIWWEQEGQTRWP